MVEHQPSEKKTLRWIRCIICPAFGAFPALAYRTGLEGGCIPLGGVSLDLSKMTLGKLRDGRDHRSTEHPDWAF